MDDDNELEWCFSYEAVGYEVVVHDNGRVGYGYLHDYNANDDIVGEVWLYNRCEMTDVPDWPDEEKLPWALPAFMVRDDIEFQLPTRNSRVEVNLYTKDDEVPLFVIYLEGEVLGVVSPGERPGWARLVQVPSILARELSDKVAQRFMD